MGDPGNFKAIIFDFGGVFDRQHETLDGFRSAAEQHGRDPEAFYDLLYGGDAWQQAKIGALTGQQYWRAIMDDLGYDATYDVAQFSTDLFAGREVDRDVVAIAERLRPRYPLGLLSNATDELEELLEVKFGITHLFTVVVNSARVGIAKPDPQAYLLTVQRLGVQPAEAFFIDDKLRNIRAAEELGIGVHHFTDAAALERDLRARGMLTD